LTLIARRLGKPTAYFMPRRSDGAEAAPDLAAELTRVANKARQFGTAPRLTSVERQAMKFIESTIRQAAELTKSIEANRIGEKRS